MTRVRRTTRAFAAALATAAAAAAAAATAAAAGGGCGGGGGEGGTATTTTTTTPGATGAAGSAAATAGAPGEATLGASALHFASIVVDTHNDVTGRLADEGVDLSKRLPDGHTDLVRMREGGLDAEFLSIWASPKAYAGERAWEYALREVEAVHEMIGANPDAAVLALTAADVRAAHTRGKTAFLIGVEGGHHLGEGTDDELLARLRRFHEMGARYMTLTWSNSNRLGGSSGDEGRDKGLTDFGRRAIATMNELGMLVDVSHVSDPMFFDAVKASTKPVIASHSSARAVANAPRNMTDEMLRAVTANGGAVCVNFGSMFLDDAYVKASDELRKKLEPEFEAIAKKYPDDPKKAGEERWKMIKDAAATIAPVPLARLVDHVEHIAKTAGHDHVCLGSDFDGVPALPAGLEDASKLPALTEALVARGWSAENVRKLLGENVLRVMAASEPAVAVAPASPAAAR